MKFTNLFLSFIILSCLILPVCANNTTPVQSDIRIEKVTMHIYGNGYYLNGISLPSGSQIIATDQFGSTIGKYIIRDDGKIGKEFGGTSDNFEIAVWRNQSDKVNRSMPIFINFAINNKPVKNTLNFKQNDNVRFDFILQDLPPTPVTPTIATTSSTISITPIPAPTATNVSIIQTQSIHQETSTMTESDYIYYGIIGTIVVIMGILIAGIFISYIQDKTSRDDVLNPEDTWNKK